MANLSQSDILPVGKFLTAEWRYLAMLNFLVDSAILEPLVPSGTELDQWRGRTYMSLVGFRFLKTKLLGVPVPGYRNFDEVNLRFYVKRVMEGGEGGEVRRGVVFIREIVPHQAIATVARFAYNEPYVAYPMESKTPQNGAEPGVVQYRWWADGKEEHIGVEALGHPQELTEGSEQQFITEHYWGYTRQRDGGTVEYQVEHPPWRVWETVSSHSQIDVPSRYGASFAEALTAPPLSAFLAEGSPVTVRRPRRIR